MCCPHKCVDFLSNHRVFAEICLQHIAKQINKYTLVCMVGSAKRRRILTASEIQSSWTMKKFFYSTKRTHPRQTISVRSDGRACVRVYVRSPLTFIRSVKWIENYFIIVIIITWNEQNFSLLLVLFLFLAILFRSFCLHSLVFHFIYKHIPTLLLSHTHIQIRHGIINGLLEIPVNSYVLIHAVCVFVRARAETSNTN